MQFQFSFKQMESSEALKKYAETKLQEKINKFVTKPIEVHVTFSVDRHDHTAHVSLIGGDGFKIEVEHTCNDLYGSIDKTLDKLVVQMQRQKSRIKHHKGLKSADKLTPVSYEAFWENDQGSGEIDAEDILKYERARARTQNR